MAGISISVLGVNEEWLRWLDAATIAPAWRNALKQRPSKPEAQIATESSSKVTSPTCKDPQSEAGRKIKQAIETACKALIKVEGELTELDRIKGDGAWASAWERAAQRGARGNRIV